MWSGVLTVTASMLLCISSSSLRKSVNCLALGKRFRGRGEMIRVDVANGHDVAQPAGVVGIGVALAFQADAGEGHPLVGRLAFRGGAIGDPIADPQGSGGLDELTARDVARHGGTPWQVRGGREAENKTKATLRIDRRRACCQVEQNQWKSQRGDLQNSSGPPDNIPAEGGAVSAIPRFCCLETGQTLIQT